MSPSSEASSYLDRLVTSNDLENLVRILPHTLGTLPATWRLLAKCHGLRNQAEYEGNLEVDDRLVTDLVAAVAEVRDALAQRDRGQ